MQKKAMQREIFVSFWKIHILYHAAKAPLLGQWMLNELEQHGYEVSPGTLYPMLHRMEKLGWLSSTTEKPHLAKSKRFFHITDLGKEVLREAQSKLAELKSEVGNTHE